MALCRTSFLSGTRLRSAPSLAPPRGLGLSVGPVAQFRDSEKVTDKIPGDAKNAAKSLERALQVILFSRFSSFLFFSFPGSFLLDQDTSPPFRVYPWPSQGSRISDH